MSIRELVNRLVWTAISAAGGVIIAAPVLGLDAAQAAGTAALIGAVNVLTLEARRQLAKYDDGAR